MPAQFCSLPEEIVTMICQYVPETLASLGLTCRELYGLTRRAFIEHYVRCPQIVIETDDIAIRCLRILEQVDNRFFLNNIRELAIHSIIVSALGREDDVPYDVEVANVVDRIITGLFKVLPRLPNCRKIVFSPELPVGPDGETFNFFGLYALNQQRNNAIYEWRHLQEARAPHEFMCENLWGTISAVAQTSNNVEVLDLERMALRDIYRALRQQSCADLTCQSVKKLVLKLHDLMLDTYRIDFKDEPAANVMLAEPPAVANGRDGHSCQSLCHRNKYESSHVDIDRSMVQSLFRHFPNLEELDYELSQEWPRESPSLFDSIPSYLPVNLRELSLKCWIGYGHDLSALLMNLSQLKRLVLNHPSFGNIDAFQAVVKACKEHPSLRSLRVKSGTVGLPTVENTGVNDLCFGVCRGKWCKRLVEEPMLDVTTPFMGMETTLCGWERYAHGKEDALTFDAEDFSDAFSTLFHDEADV